MVAKPRWLSTACSPSLRKSANTCCRTCRTQFKTEAAFKMMGVRMRKSLLEAGPHATQAEFAALARARYQGLMQKKKKKSGSRDDETMSPPLQLYAECPTSSRALDSHRTVPQQPALALPSAEDMEAVERDAGPHDRVSDAESDDSSEDSSDDSSDGARAGNTFARPLASWIALLERYDRGCPQAMEDVGGDLRDFFDTDTNPDDVLS